ncbi:hypothetical protein IF1G_11263 [Cordyceps javanica]|uniref:Uncharacterized protein n=1 Tax=Cordyceps javanica TaxID=43265 RepID=A0A545UKS1_9HYPO|nr:hypothetical protein IF1G_11263 [Cordyceps javanica]
MFEAEYPYLGYNRRSRYGNRPEVLSSNCSCGYQALGNTLQKPLKRLASIEAPAYSFLGRPAWEAVCGSRQLFMLGHSVFPLLV